MENLIEVRNVSKAFGEQQVLKAVSMDIKKGEICGLIGRNGSGKTVLLKVICGLVHPDDGEVIVRGKKIGEELDFPENTGVLIEAPTFQPYLSGWENIWSLASIRGIIDKKTAADYIRLFGLDPKSKKHVSKYSLGMRQRLGLCQAVMEGQDILILDEPMNGLDKEGVAEIRKLLLGWKEEGRTILIASHYPQDIEILCDRVYAMEGGKCSEYIQ